MLYSFSCPKMFAAWILSWTLLWELPALSQTFYWWGAVASCLAKLQLLAPPTFLTHDAAGGRGMSGRLPQRNQPPVIWPRFSALLISVRPSKVQFLATPVLTVWTEWELQSLCRRAEYLQRLLCELNCWLDNCMHANMAT